MVYFSHNLIAYRDEFNKIVEQHNNTIIENEELEKEAKRISSFLNEDISSIILPKSNNSQSNINSNSDNSNNSNNNARSLWLEKESNECDAYNEAKTQFETLLDPDTDDPLNDRGRNFSKSDYSNRYPNNRNNNNWNRYNNKNIVPVEYKNQMKLKKELSDPKVQESMLLNKYLEQPMIYGPEYMKGKSRIEKSILNEMPRRRALESIFERRLGLTRFFNRLMDEPPYATRQGSYFRNEAMNRSWPRIANNKDKNNPYVEKWNLEKLLESVDVVVEDRIIPDHPQEEMNLSNRFDDYALIEEGRDNFMKGARIETINDEEKKNNQLKENPFDYKSDIEIGEYSSDGIVSEREQPGGYNPLIMKREYRYKWPRFKQNEIGEKPYEGFSDSELKERVVEIMPNIYYFKDDPKKKYYEYRNGRFHLLDKRILKRPVDPEVEYNNSLMATSDEFASDLEPAPPHEFYSRNYNRTEKSLIPRAIGQFLDGLKQLENNEEVDENTKDEIRTYMENSFIKTVKQNKLEFADFCGDKDIPNNREGIYSEPLDENDELNNKLPSNLPKSRLWKLLGTKFTKIAERHYNLSPSERVEMEIPKVRNLPYDQQEIYNSSKYSFYSRNRKTDYQKFYERNDEDFLVQDYSYSDYKKRFGEKAAAEVFGEDNNNNNNNNQNNRNDENNNSNENNSTPIFGENTFSFYQSRILKYPNNSLFSTSGFTPSLVLLSKKRFDLFDSLDVLLPSDEEKRFHDDYSSDEIHINSNVAPANLGEILKNSNLKDEELIKIIKEYPKYKKMNLTDKEAMNVIKGILPDETKYRYNPYAVPEDAEGILKPPNGIDPKLFRAMTLFQTRNNHKIYDEGEDNENSESINEKGKKGGKRKPIEKVEMLSSESDTDFDPNDNIENPMNEVFNWRKKKEPNMYAKDIAESPEGTNGQAGSISFVLDQKQVQHTTKGGRSALAVVLGIAGNLEGCVGYGYGRARDVSKARTKALVFARNNYVGCDLYEGRTLYHEVSGKYNSTRVLIKPAAPATGIVACDSLWAILFCLGIKDAVTKVSGNRNIYSLVNATFAALDKHQSVWDVSRIRGQRIRDMRYSHLWNRSKLRDAEKKYGLDPHRF